MRRHQLTRGARVPTEEALARIPWWLAWLAVGLLILVFVLAGVLLYLVMTDRGPTARPVAIETLERRAERTKDPALLVELGFEYRKAGMLPEALRTFERALQLDPNNVAALYHKAAVLLELDRPKAAEAAFWGVLNVDPTHASASKALGELYASRGHYRSLLVAVGPAAEANPDLADLQYLLGLGLEKTGDRRGAARAYWNALQRDPNLKEARDGLARVQRSVE